MGVPESSALALRVTSSKRWGLGGKAQTPSTWGTSFLPYIHYGLVPQVTVCVLWVAVPHTWL